MSDFTAHTEKLDKWYYKTAFINFLFVLGGALLWFLIGIIFLILAIVLYSSKSKLLKNNQTIVEKNTIDNLSTIENLSKEVEHYKSMFTPELSTIESQYQKIKEQEEILEELKIKKAERIKDLETEVAKRYDKLKYSLEKEIKPLKEKNERLKHETYALNYAIKTHTEELESIKNDIVEMNDEKLYQDFGVYTPIYNLMNSEAYKDKISVIREKQKRMIKEDTACNYCLNFRFNNSLSQGRKLVKDSVKQVLRTFNNECETCISKVKFNNVETIRNRIIKSKNSLEKLNNKMEITISEEYLSLKLEELNLCYEYAYKKQEEKERAKEERARLREEAKVKREIEEARKKALKEQKHYENALQTLNQKLLTATGEERNELLRKQAELSNHLEGINKSIEDLDYRAANKRAGYVYIISNIGSFGEDVYKIGMTRRLEPMDRIRELGDASVPFNFDVHAMIFSDDAPSLEAALHNAFEDKKLNMINKRREFFKVSLNEIKDVVKKNYDKTVEFKTIPEAEQYRETMMLKKQVEKIS